MRADEALATLAKLEAEANLGNEENFIEWRSKVAAVLRATFGSNSDQYRAFNASSKVKKEGYTTAKGLHRDLELWRLDAASRGKAELRAAIFLLEAVYQES